MSPWPLSMMQWMLPSLVCRQTRDGSIHCIMDRGHGLIAHAISTCTVFPCQITLRYFFKERLPVLMEVVEAVTPCAPIASVPGTMCVCEGNTQDTRDSHTLDAIFHIFLQQMIHHLATSG